MAGAKPPYTCPLQLPSFQEQLLGIKGRAGRASCILRSFVGLNELGRKAGVGSLPCSEMLLHPSVTSLPSVFPMLSPSGPPHTPVYALVVSQILRVNTTLETNQFN